MTSNNLREHIPLKQGLRQQGSGSQLGAGLPAQRAYSIKTRIKTSTAMPLQKVAATQRAYSIKTRIKTYLLDSRSAKATILREHIPLKQGLRPTRVRAINRLLSTQRAYSIKTRIKTNLKCGWNLSRNWTQRAYSIKTRIKTCKSIHYFPLIVLLREHIPLKQGLRLFIDAVL